MELDEVSQLLDVSKEQYDEILSIVQRHTDETVNWLSNMAAEFSWVAQAVSNSSTVGNIFRLSMVRRKLMKRQINRVYDWDSERESSFTFVKLIKDRFKRREKSFREVGKHFSQHPLIETVVGIKDDFFHPPGGTKDPRRTERICD